VDEREAVARTWADAARAADLMADLICAARAVGGDDPATVTRLLVRRLLRRRSEDRHLLELVRWFATTHDLPAALAAGGWTSDPTYPGGWRSPPPAPT
jgi:hypothetical protein